MMRRSSTLLLAAVLCASVLTGCGQPQEVSPVYTDWSKLADYQPPEALYETFQPYSGKQLTARDDYGPLLRYIGASVMPDNYFPDVMPLYGLMTADGRVVTDPVYAAVYLVGGAVRGDSTDNPFLILRTGNPDPDAYPGDAFSSGSKVTVAAPDGSWVLEGDYCAWDVLEGRRLALKGLDGSATVIDENGQTTFRFTRDMLTPYLGEDYYWDQLDGNGNMLIWFNGVGCVLPPWEERQDGGEEYCLYLDSQDGTVSRQPPEGFSIHWPEYTEEPQRDFPGYRNVWPTQDPFTGTLYYRAKQEGDDWVIDLLDETGRVLLPACETGFTYPSWVWNGLIAKVETEVFSYYTVDGTCVFRYPLRSNTD